MRASRVGRIIAVAAVGMSLTLGAREARAQTVVHNCEGLLVLGASGGGRPNGKASLLVLGVSRDVDPDGRVTSLVLGASDEGLLCVPGLQAVAVGAPRVALRAGEDVYVRGFSSFTSFTNSPPQKSRVRDCPKCPKLTRAE